ncbi:PQQ-dependent sugar dehydrogenase [Spirosoma linguale]|uniref:Glucose sorbosone dehydrogenase n=1 Tax=Spirosoma linguale (strain ATCC 33905 / DSM 74 / LMG 10896 / Claus 1) TaxID=504472 RepID=D2QP92_SPILD|nr:glucose sorbosone dehydrogenase [Spirosoma linguale DSM 74]
MRTSLSAFTAFGTLLFIFVLAVSISFQSMAQNGQIVYKNYCAGCHGAQLQGSAGPALIKKEWKHGGDRNSLLKTIRNGVPSTEMIKFEGVLSAKEIEAVTDFILNAQTSPELVKKTDLPLRVDTKLYKLRIEKLVTEGLTNPWGIEFIDANHALVTGKNGELFSLVNGKLDNQKITGLPKTYGTDLVGGMMDLALDPEYKTNGWIYIGFSYNPQNSPDKKTPGMTKIVRGKVREHQWVDEQTLFQVPDSLLVTGGTRWGCRFLFDKQGHLFFTIGDMNRAGDSQILSRPSGKIYRINPDGSIPKDNPLYGKANYLQAIYSWGNRNAQGLAQHPQTGVIYASEHGPQGGDELNILKKGANYGWPVITYGIDYNGSIITTETQREGMEQPITYWTPSIAVSAIEFVTGNRFPRWQNNLLVTALKFEEIRRLVVRDDKVTEQEVLLKGYGRVRDLKIGPDGALYVLTNSPDALLRITPE